MPNHQDAITAGVAALLDEGEEVLAALVASPRGGSTAAAAGGLAGVIGSQWAGKNADGAEQAGLIVQRSCGVVLTNHRLVTLDLSISMMGAVKGVKSVLSAVPLTEIGSVAHKRVGAAGVLDVRTGGASFKLEAKPGPAKNFADAFEAAARR